GLTATGTVAFTNLASGLVYSNNGTLSSVSTSTWTFASSTLLSDNNTFSGTNTFSNPISGSITGNAATVTTNANLTGAVTSVGNATSLGSFSSANLSGALTDKTGSGSTVFGTAPIFTTNITSPLVIGGTGVTDILSLKGTTSNGTLTSPAIQALVGNNGTTAAMTILNNGNVGI